MASSSQKEPWFGISIVKDADAVENIDRPKNMWHKQTVMIIAILKSYLSSHKGWMCMYQAVQRIKIRISKLEETQTQN